MARSTVKTKGCFEAAIGLTDAEARAIEKIAEAKGFKTTNTNNDYARATEKVLADAKAQRGAIIEQIAKLDPQAAQAYAAPAPAANDDLDAMFDEIVAQESVIEAPKAPRAPRAPRATSDVPEAGFGKTTTPRAPRTATQAAKSAAKNAASGIGNTIDALGALFSTKPGTLGSGPVFNEDTYAAAKPLFAQAVADLKASGQDIREVMQAVIRMVMAKFGGDTVAQMKPYIVKFTQDVRDGLIDVSQSVVENGETNGDTENKENQDDSGIEGESAGALDELSAEQVGGTGGRGSRGSGANGSRNSRRKGNSSVDGEGGKAGRGRGNGTAEPDLFATGEGGDGVGQGKSGGVGPDGGPVSGNEGQGSEDRQGSRGGIRTGSGEVIPAAVPATNFVITPDLQLGVGGEVAKYNGNLAAIRTLKTIESEHRRATPDEQRILAKFVGWGGLSKAFRNRLTGEYNKEWLPRVQELEALLTPAELKAASASTPNAHYTSETVTGFMWRAAKRLGFGGGMALESSVGSGNFIGLMPEHVRAGTFLTGIELDSITARIAGALYPQSNIVHSAFEKLALPDNTFDLNIGNPPFGAISLRMKYNPKHNGKSIHNQFFLGGMDALKPGGLQAMVVSRYLMDAQDASTREALALKAELLGAIRLPGSAFKGNAGTEVVTDILFLKKRTTGEQAELQDLWNARGAKPPAKESYGDRAERLAGQARLSQVLEWTKTTSLPDPLGGDAMVVSQYFADNPHMIAGVMDRSGSMQFGKDIDVKLPASELEAKLDSLMAQLPGVKTEHRSDEVNARTEAMHKALGESMSIMASGREIGSIYYDESGDLTEIAEKVDEQGKTVVSKMKITAQSPWSSQLSLNLDGKWFKEVAALDEKGEKVKVGVKINPKTGKPTPGRNLYVREVYQNDSDVPTGMRLGEEGFAKLQRLVAIRELYVQQINLETNSAQPEVMEANRAKLRAAYEGFVADHGYINEQKNASIVSDMPDEGLLLSLELKYRPAVTAARAKAKGINASPARAEPNAILTRAVSIPPARKDSAASISDAVAIVLGEMGRIDVPRVAQLRAISEEQAIKDMTEGDAPIAYVDPETREITEKNQYLSGNVRKKLAAAIAANLPANIKALEAVQPEPWTSDKVTAHMGATWVPPNIYADFVKHLLGRDAKVTFSQLTNLFEVSAPGATAVDSSKWGTERAKAVDLLNAILNNTRIAIYDGGYRDVPRVLNETDTQSAIDKKKELLEEFDNWIFKDGDRRQELTQLFNDLYNTRVSRQYDGAHMEFPGKVPDSIIKFRRNQINAVWRGIVDRFVMYDHAVGAGKAQPLDAKILTPTGWKLMGDIRQGDMVMSVDGKPTLVEAVFPQGEKEIFRVVFSDGSSTECCDEHLWTTSTYEERSQAQRALTLGKNWDCGKPKVRSLAEIRETLVSKHLGAKNHSIPMVEPVQFIAQPLPIAPYLMGVLLGDGGFSHGGVSISVQDEEIIAECQRIAPEGVKINRIKTGDKCPTWTLTSTSSIGRLANNSINPAKDALDSLGLRGKQSHDKFIPECYLVNSVDNRIALLRGLMDTDGSVSKRGMSSYFYTCSTALRDGVVQLVQSLGGIVSVKEKQPTYTHKGEKKNGRTCYVLCVKLPAEINPFHLARKANAVVPKSSYPAVRYIVDVQPVGVKLAQCIRVAHPSHLYVTDDFIVTHNTFTGISRAIERRRMGLSNKPAVVVPNHLVSEWATQAYRLYPGAKILAASKKDLEPKNRRRLFAKIAAGDWDLVIVPHSSFKFIGISPETEERFINDELRVANAALKEAEDDAEPGQRFKPLSVKAAEALILKLENRMDVVRGKSGKDQLLTFEQMGIDDLTVDESHEFKNLTYSTRLTDVRGLGPAAGSQKAFDLYTKMRILHETNGSSAFLTGTPISNSAVEMYTIMRYLAPSVLQESGLEHFDAFRAQYVQASEKHEPTEAGNGLKVVNRLGRNWSNMRSLMDGYYSVADVVTNDDIKAWFAEDNPGREFPMPKVKGGSRRTVKANPTPTQQRLIQEVIDGYNGLPNIEDVQDRNKERLRLMDRARKLALHAKAWDHNLTDEPGGKLDMVVDEAMRLYKQWGDQKGTQLIFLDRSVPKAQGDDKTIKAYDALRAKLSTALENDDEKGQREAIEALESYDTNEIAELRAAQAGGWNAYQHMADGLIAKGVPKEQIAFIQNYTTDLQKKALFEAVNDGTIRFLFGSSQRMGAGMNVQERLVGLHHVDVSWKPSDIEQREGRIIRQGNRLAYNEDGTPNIDGFEVEIMAYVTERSMDAKMWDLNATKLRMVNGIRYYDGEFEMDFEDDDAIDMAEIAAIASGDPLMLERIKLTATLEDLYRKRKSYDRRVQSAEDSLRRAERNLVELPIAIAKAKAIADPVNEAVMNAQADQLGRSVTVDGQKFASLESALGHAEEQIKIKKDGDEKAPFTLDVDGTPLSSVDKVREAIADKMGDVAAFVAELGGKKVIRRATVAREIRALIGTEFRDMAPTTFGSMYGFRMTVSSDYGRFNSHNVNLSVTIPYAGKVETVMLSRDISPEKHKSGQAVPVLTSSLRAVVDQLATKIEGLQYAYTRGAEEDLASAKENIPTYREAMKEKFKFADELDAANTRLDEVQDILADRADAKKNAPAAPAVEDEVKSEDGEATAFSRATKPATGLPVSRVTAIAQAIKATWKNAPDIVVAESMDDEAIPANVRAYNQKQMSLGATGAPQGFIYGGKVYLIADQLSTPGHVVETLFHEALGHIGLRGVFGKSLEQVLNQVVLARRPEVLAKAKKYRLARDYDEAARMVNEDRVKAEKEALSGEPLRQAALSRLKADLLHSAEEVLAEMAQAHPELGIVQRAIAAIRTWLRTNIPQLQAMKLTDAEVIRNFILPARAYVEQGGGGPKGGIAFSRGTNDTVTNPNDVVGNQGGRYADDTTPGAGIKKPMTVNPKTLVFRESDQNRKDELTGETDDFDPIVVIDDGVQLSILDGHNRASVAIDRGDSIEAVKVTQAEYDRLQERGFDDGEIAWAALQRSGQSYAAGNLESQFPGSAISNGGDKAWDDLIENEPTAPDSGGADIRFSRSATLSATANKVVDTLADHFSHAGTMSWWHKSFGSPYNLAQKSRPFKRVFTSAQDFLNDVSFYANEAADHAAKLLPKLENWKDIGKSPISAADNKAIEAPIFEGTLLWARDEAGKPVKVTELEDKYADLSDEDKGQMLMKNRVVTEAQLKRWKASQLDIYSGAIRNRFEATYLRPGVAWTDAELKSIFNLTPEQADLYHQFHAAVGTSLDNMAKSEMLRYGGKDVADLRNMVLDAASADDAAMLLRDHLLELADEDRGRSGILADMANGMIDRADKVNKLKKEGYAPLSRFGQYSVDVVVDGERQYFGLFETKAEANQMAKTMRDEFGADNVESGTVAQAKFEQYKGITPESLELFGNMLGLDSTGDKESDKAFQEYLKLTKNNRSAMKRLIHRKGIAGYSTDTGRVLAAFIYSNARQTAAGLHMGEMSDALNAIHKTEGQLSDYATKYADYVKNPQEEAQAIRGLMFAQYLGGNVASAFVNFTQPFTVSFPYLSQYGGVKGAAAALGKAMADQRKGEYEPALAHALKIADEQGVTQPQSVHELQAQARGAATLRPGDGTRRGNAIAMASNGLSKLSLGWGKLFGMAEQINRRTTFIAAYRIAVEKGIANPGAFATKAVDETQFINNKGNKAVAARGAIGSTMMTFKSYSINYMELLHRMAAQGGPEGKRAVALAMVMLFLMAGAGGLPFMDDLDDLIDGIAQRMGYNFSSKKAKQEFLEHWIGKAGAQFVDRGITGIAGIPIDIAGRMGMGNLLPGTGLFMPKADHTSDMAEFLGVAADLGKRASQAGGQLLDGHPLDAALSIAPKAIGNLAQGARMMDKGYYQDAKGSKVIDTTPTEAAFKAIGFQPQSVAKVGESNWIMQSAKNVYNLKSQAIRAQWAKGIFENDPAMVESARSEMQAWNEKNPGQRITPNMPAIIRKVKEMRKTKEARIADTSPKAMRAQVRRDIAESHAQ